MYRMVTVDIKFYDVPLVVEAEYDRGEAGIGGPLEWARPEYAPDAVACRVLCGGIDIMGILSPAQVRDIEHHVVTACSGD